MSDEEDNDGVQYADYLRQVIMKGVMSGALPIVTTDPNLLDAQAQKFMSKKGYEYIKGGAGEGATMDANRLAFRGWRLVPKVMTPTSPRDLSVTLFGQKFRCPVFMAPVGVQGLFHEEKEIGTAKACEALGVPFIMSSAATVSIEELGQATQGPKWFQLYWSMDEAITASVLKRAKDNGFTALVVTLDTWTLAWRPRDLDIASVPFAYGDGDQVGFSDPVFREQFKELSDGLTPEEDPKMAGLHWTGHISPGISHSWDDLKILRKYWDGPILLKGILSVEDAKEAARRGVEGIIVSNHGGRQLDGAVSSLEVLPDIVDAVGDKLTVMIDSGIRTGADIAKALAIGAKAVCVGRPVVYGLGINGREGAEAVLAGLLADFDISMGFVGAKKIADLQRNCLRKAGPEGIISNL